MQEMLRNRPFEPCEVRLSNGDVNQARHPEFGFVLRSNILVGYHDSDCFAVCSLRLALRGTLIATEVERLAFPIPHQNVTAERNEHRPANQHPPGNASGFLQRQHPKSEDCQDRTRNDEPQCKNRHFHGIGSVAKSIHHPRGRRART